MKFSHYYAIHSSVKIELAFKLFTIVLFYCSLELYEIGERVNIIGRGYFVGRIQIF